MRLGKDLVHKLRQAVGQLGWEIDPLLQPELRPVVNRLQQYSSNAVVCERDSLWRS